MHETVPKHITVHVNPNEARQEDSPTTSQPKGHRRFRLIAGVLALCGVACTSIGAYVVYHKHVKNHSVDIVTNIQQAPGIRVTLTAKRKSMALNGQLTAQAYIVPRFTGANGTLKFNAILNQPGSHVTKTYLLLDDRAYWSESKNDTIISAGCLDPAHLPPVHLMEASLANSNVVDGIDKGSETCDGKWLQLQFAGESFVFCNSPSNKLTHAMGQHLDLSIEYLSNPVEIPAMEVPSLNNTALDCPVINANQDHAVPSSSYLHTRRSLLATASEIIKVAQGQRRLALFDRQPSCSCKGIRKPCLFVHGVGIEKSEPLSDTFAETWGDIENHAPCCSSVKFAHFEMQTRGWDNFSLQQEFCDAALNVSGSNSSKELNDLILVTFSMSNLVASGAFTNGVCHMTKDKVTWVSLAAPMQGSQGANVLVSQCKANTLLDESLSALGKCPVSNAYLKLKEQATVSEALQDSFLAIQETRAKYVSKTLCGVDPIGLFSKFSVVMGALSSIVYGQNSPSNDGMVTWSSCSAGVVDEFSTDASTSGNYQANINHFDASFRNGDGWWGSDRKPVKWFECAL